MTGRLTHLDETGAAHMVDVSAKSETARTAIAEGCVIMQLSTLRAIHDNRIAKGDVLATARVAAIMAAKKTPGLIPLCHPLMLTKIAVDIAADHGLPGLRVRVAVALNGKTGVEMEALTAVSVACLTIYDMAKAIDKDMTISDIRLIEKHGGKSGTWKRTTK
ncbi:MAG: Cyclic pyranopterin monophosphate synthase accessory protein [Candidatus Tokpelaia hoelldobleri]|uniref:Cyclic pyranopterin monophosphate synthase n=1 Tax=Candidatus Tokpelaia hoelldobleri TaxID=1902579 RepID=A0A1U9JU24_9HYPH|nr:MAG: Cyclic pyranopterin monophosphate synthase accessory protein [Candidatus Tokpelaia hoelldoblerii]